MDLERLRELSGQEVPHKELYENKRELDEQVSVEGVDLFQLERMMDAARRGLALANQLRGPTKKQHMSRVLSNMNRIRAALKRAIDAQDDDLKAGIEGEEGIDVEELDVEEIEAAPAPDTGIDVQEVEPEHIEMRGGARQRR